MNDHTFTILAPVNAPDAMTARSVLMAELHKAGMVVLDVEVKDVEAARPFNRVAIEVKARGPLRCYIMQVSYRRAGPSAADMSGTFPSGDARND